MRSEKEGVRSEKEKDEIASHPSDARNDSKKYLIFKWLYQFLDFYLYF
ncbi:hypothetical protein [Thermodesulfovibrio hydrogeniphilus]